MCQRCVAYEEEIVCLKKTHKKELQDKLDMVAQLQSNIDHWKKEKNFHAKMTKIASDELERVRSESEAGLTQGIVFDSSCSSAIVLKKSWQLVFEDETHWMFTVCEE